MFRILALALLAYVPAAILARPDFVAILTGTLVPTMRFNREFLSLLVAVIGTTLSAYLYTWPLNEEVEEEKAMGRLTLSQRTGASRRELSHSRRDVLFAALESMGKPAVFRWNNSSDCNPGRSVLQ